MNEQTTYGFGQL